MKRLNVILATVLACGAVEITAQRDALPPANLPPPFPRAGAKQLLENDRVRVWDYTFTPHRVGPLHRHVRAAVAVWLEGGKLKATSARRHVERQHAEEVHGNVFQARRCAHGRSHRRRTARLCV